MSEKSSSFSSDRSSSSPSKKPPPTLLPPSKNKKGDKSCRALRTISSVFKSMPVFGPKCFSPLPMFLPQTYKNLSSTRRITGTLFGNRKGKVSISLQESPMYLPSHVIELAMQTHVLLKEMGSGMVRIALECEKKHDEKKGSEGNLLEETRWSMFFNGKKMGGGVRREPSEEDVRIMEHLRGISMGAGVLPVSPDGGAPDGEVAYLRSPFDHVVGSRDSETLYMVSPNGNSGPDLTVFFVRV